MQGTECTKLTLAAMCRIVDMEARLGKVSPSSKPAEAVALEAGNVASGDAGADDDNAQQALTARLEDAASREEAIRAKEARRQATAEEEARKQQQLRLKVCDIISRACLLCRMSFAQYWCVPVFAASLHCILLQNSGSNPEI